MKAAVQVLKKTEDLKEQCTGDFLNDNESWNRHQKLQELYQQLLVIDLEYALDKKVEQDLWNYVFKNHINRLQCQAKDRKNPQRSESQENLVWFLETASGFYLQLLQELCETFDLDVPCRRKGSVYGISKETKPNHRRNDVTLPHKSSSLYICQHCLVHMGDIARYRNQSLQAETFYRHAAELVPSNGQPYNQLAILEAAKGDKLSTVFYYVRSIAVKYPFPVASTNLQKMFSKMAHDDFQHEGKTKLSVYDYVSTFLQFHALIHLTSDLDKAQHLGKILATNLTILIATESLTAWKLVQMMAINLFAVMHATRGLETATLENSDLEPETLSEDEQTAYNLVLELIASTLNGLLLLVYTMKGDVELRSYYVSPVIKLSLEWLRQDPSHLKAASFTGKFQIWPSFCKLLNGIQQGNVTFEANKYADVPLPEDWDLQSFLPLYKAYKCYKFRESLPHFTHEDERNLRTHRLVALGQWLCEQEIYGVKLMTVQMLKDDGTLTFEAITPQTPSSDVLKLLEEMTIGWSDDVTSSLSCSDTTAANRQVNGSLIQEENGGGSTAVVSIIGGEGNGVDSIGRSKGNVVGGRQGKGQFLSNDFASEKTLMTKDGQNKTVLTNTTRERKTRQNVALQTIMQKKTLGPRNDSEDSTKPKSEGKMVTFKTPSPSPPASSGGTPPLASMSALSPVNVSQSYTSQQQQHHLMYPKLKVSSSYRNGSLGLDSSVPTNPSRNSYSGLTPNLDPGYNSNQSSNKFNFYGGNEGQPYPISHIQSPLGLGGGGVGGGRSPPVRDLGTNASGIQQQQQGMNRMGMMNVGGGGGGGTGGSQTQPNVLNLPSQHLLLGFNPNGIGSNRPQLIHGPQNRMNVTQARVAAAAVALAAQKQQLQQQQQSFAMNAAAIFGPGTQAPPPPPPPWFQTSQSSVPLKPPPNMEQFMAQLQGGATGPHGPHLNLTATAPPPQSMSFANVMQNPSYGTPPPPPPQRPPPQQFTQPPPPAPPQTDPTHFIYQMMGQMSSEGIQFPQYPPPPPLPVPTPNSNQNVISSQPHTMLSQQSTSSNLNHEMMVSSDIGNQHRGMIMNRSSSESGSMGDNRHQLKRHLGSGVAPPPPPYDVGLQQTRSFGQKPHQSPSRRQENLVIGDDSQSFNDFGSSEMSDLTMPTTSTYSLFNSPWSSGLNLTNNAANAAAAAATATNDQRDYPPISTTANEDMGGFLQPGLQSLWSGPGPSPLERLLEQQKLKKDTAPH